MSQPDPARTGSPTLLIVGGVAGGASAATRARRMNERARIVLFEKDAHVSFANCGLPYHLGGEIAEREKLLVAKPALFERRFGIEVATRQEVTRIHRERRTVEVLDHATGATREERYDKLILAPGAAPIVPPVPGIEARGVFTLRNLDDTDRIMAALPAARRAVVVGAGFIGLEVAEQLARRGLEVEVVELQPQVLPPLDPEMAEPLARELQAAGIRLTTGTGFSAVLARDGAATGLQLADGSQRAADLVVLGLGVRPSTRLASEAGLAIGASGGIATDAFMRTSDPDIYAVGDAAEYDYGPLGGRQRVPLAGMANRTGRLAGEHAVTGSAEAAPRAWGTAILRVGALGAGIAGLSLKAALKAGLQARAVHITANHHAGYFPGAKPLLLKLVYEAPSGRILGAQAVGEAGVDKRLDVVAALLAAGGTVRQLAGLDLAYAPPFGSAKDPLHMAAFAAGNDLAGVAPLLPPDADLSSFQVVDVRGAGEIAALPLAGTAHAVAIPLDQLRGRLVELDPSKPTVVSCQTGLRSHVAARILLQHGFGRVFNLSGAAKVRDLALNPQRGLVARPPAAPLAACGAQPATVPAPCGAPAAACDGGGADNCSAVELGARLAAGPALDLLDVRSPGEFRGGHVRGARNVPLDALTPEAVKAGRPAGAVGPTLVLCHSGGRAAMAAHKLRAAGMPAQVVAGGTRACMEAGLPIHRLAGGTWPIERQVRLVAGLLILTGAALGVLVHPGFFGLSAFVGAGLAFAGLTDFCGMGLLLARCPWNR